MNTPADQQDILKNLDPVEIFRPYNRPLDIQLTESELSLKNEMKLLKQTRKVLHDVILEINSYRIKEKAKAGQVKPTDRAKEEATKLLKSGAISFTSSSDRHTFKRRGKEVDVGACDLEEADGCRVEKKQRSYTNFVLGEQLPSSACTIDTIPSHSDIPPFISPTKMYMCQSFRNDYPASLGQISSPTDSAGDLLGNQEVHQSFMTNLYVSCENISDSFILKTFEEIGPICHISFDARKRYAFVTMKNQHDVEAALKLDGTDIDGRKMHVRIAHRQFQPRVTQTLSPNISNLKNRKIEDTNEGSDAKVVSRSLINYDDID